MQSFSEEAAITSSSFATRLSAVEPSVGGAKLKRFVALAAGHRSPVTGHRSPVTGHESPVNVSRSPQRQTPTYIQRRRSSPVPHIAVS